MSKFSKDQIEIMRKAYGTLKTMNPSSPTYKKFIKFLGKLPKDQLKQLAAANIKFVSMLAKNRLRGESIKERSSYDSDNEIQSQYMKDDVVYNRPENIVMIRSQGNKIVVVCKDEDQVQPVMDRMSTDTCILSDYEEWDEGEDMKWILTFKVTDDYEQLPEKN